MAKIRKTAIVERMSKAVEKSGGKSDMKKSMADEKKEMKELKNLMGKGKGKRGNC